VAVKTEGIKEHNQKGLVFYSLSSICQIKDLHSGLKIRFLKFASL
jgi:hypothetical protein